jgi:hypothetical protein
MDRPIHPFAWWTTSSPCNLSPADWNSTASRKAFRHPRRILAASFRSPPARRAHIIAPGRSHRTARGTELEDRNLDFTRSPSSDTHTRSQTVSRGPG